MARMGARGELAGRMPDTQRAQIRGARNRLAGGGWPAQSDGQVRFGLAGNGSGDDDGHRPPSSLATPSQRPAGEGGGNPAVQPLPEAANANVGANVQDAPSPPRKAEQQIGQPTGAGFDNGRARPREPFETFPQAALKTETNANGAEGDGTTASGYQGAR
jgi:hypothetical protein